MYRDPAHAQKNCTFRDASHDGTITVDEYASKAMAMGRKREADAQRTLPAIRPWPWTDCITRFRLLTPSLTDIHNTARRMTAGMAGGQAQPSGTPAIFHRGAALAGADLDPAAPAGLTIHAYHVVSPLLGIL